MMPAGPPLGWAYACFAAALILGGGLGFHWWWNSPAHREERKHRREQRNLDAWTTREMEAAYAENEARTQPFTTRRISYPAGPAALPQLFPDAVEAAATHARMTIPARHWPTVPIPMYEPGHRVPQYEPSHHGLWPTEPIPMPGEVRTGLTSAAVPEPEALEPIPHPAPTQVQRASAILHDATRNGEREAVAVLRAWADVSGTRFEVTDLSLATRLWNVIDHRGGDYCARARELEAAP